MNALFEASINEEECIACEECLDRCPVGAITIEDTAVVDRNKCLGCGLCAGACPSEAITMILRDDAEEPFDRALDLGLAILQGKQEATKKRPD
jgi:ferredoxin